MLEPLIILVAPFTGAAAGFLAGAYPRMESQPDLADQRPATATATLTATMTTLGEESQP